MAPASVNVPPPVFVSAIAPAPSLISPLNVVFVPSLPTVNVDAEVAELVTVPPEPLKSESEPIAGLKPSRSSVAPAATETGEFAGRVFPPNHLASKYCSTAWRWALLRRRVVNDQLAELLPACRHELARPVGSQVVGGYRPGRDQID